MEKSNLEKVRVEVPENSGAFVRIGGECEMLREELEDGTQFSIPPADDSRYGVSSQEKQIMAMILPPMPELPYPLKIMPMWKGEPALEYDIPDGDREKVFRQIYPFKPCPQMDEYRFDLHSEKTFQIREYRVIRELDRNLLVSPYYPESGGMVVDWMDADDHDSCIRQLRSE